MSVFVQKTKVNVTAIEEWAGFILPVALYRLPKPVVTKGATGEWDEQRANRPCVVRVNGAYYLYYAGVDAAGFGRVGLATSNNGFDFTSRPENPIYADPKGRGIATARVMIDERGRFYMYHRLWASGPKGGWLISRATSNDGITWTYEDDVFEAPPEWVNGDITQVFKLGKRWYMFLMGYDGVNDRLYLTESDDGIEWTTPELIMDVGICDSSSADRRESAWASVVALSEKGPFLIFYQTSPPSATMGVAFSSDLKRWLRRRLPLFQGLWDPYILIDVLSDGKQTRIGWKVYVTKGTACELLCDRLPFSYGASLDGDWAITVPAGGAVDLMYTSADVPLYGAFRMDVPDKVKVTVFSTERCYEFAVDQIRPMYLGLRPDRLYEAFGDSTGDMGKVALLKYDTAAAIFVVAIKDVKGSKVVLENADTVDRTVRVSLFAES